MAVKSEEKKKVKKLTGTLVMSGNVQPSIVSARDTQDVQGKKYASAQEVKILNALMIGVMMVIFVALFAQIFVWVDSYRSAASDKTDSYNALRDKIDTQNEKINEMNLELKLLKDQAPAPAIASSTSQQ